ncbi:hypothetical protein AB0B25_31260 [Nocardia sp. NPDC049190]
MTLVEPQRRPGAAESVAWSRFIYGRYWLLGTFPMQPHRLL